MTRVIYADVLVITNIIINYLLLRTCAVIMSIRPRGIRLLAASFLGGAYSLIIFADFLPSVALAAIKIAFVLSLVPTAFKIKSLKSFLRCCAVFMLVNFAFAGVMLAIWLTFMPEAMLFKNGDVYFDVNPVALTLCALGCYGVMRLISRFGRSRVPTGRIFRIEIENNGKTVSGRALYDTGNTLTEGFSGRPVAVCEAKFLEPLTGGTFGVDYTSGELPEGFRLIPMSTVGGSGVLPAFKAEKLRIFIGGRAYEIKDIYVAAAGRGVIGSDFAALLGTPVFDEINNEVKNFEEAVN